MVEGTPIMCAPAGQVASSGSVVFRPTGCDSSDCRVCQSRCAQPSPYTSKLSSFNGRKRSGSLHTTADQHWSPASSGLVEVTATTLNSASMSPEAVTLTASGCQPVSDAHQLLAGSKRCRIARTVSEPVQPADVVQGRCIGYVSSGDSHEASQSIPTRTQTFTTCRKAPWHGGWCWETRFADYIAPAPAALHGLEWLTPSSSGHGPGAEIICALEFSEDGLFLASAGVGKQIFLYNMAPLFDNLEPDEVQQMPGGASTSGREHHSTDTYLTFTHRMPSKVSSLAWVPGQDGIITVGDYDGCLTQVHLGSGHILADLEGGHSGRRIWSVAHSPIRPHLCASASDDRTVRLWGGSGLSQRVATLCPNPRASACGVDFSPVDPHILALASADHSVYLYDLRNTSAPLLALRHHQRSVSYVKFLGTNRLVSASTDASLALWGLTLDSSATSGSALLSSAASGAADAASAHLLDYAKRPGSALSRQAAALNGPVLTPECASTLSTPEKLFQGHRNEKNFVGLAVRPEDGLLACGSESSAVYAYHTSWSEPLACAQLWEQCQHAEEEQQQQDMLGNMGAGVFGKPCQCLGPSGMSSATKAGSAPVGDQFVSAVCWQPAAAARTLGLPPILAAATSTGAVRLLSLKKH